MLGREAVDVAGLVVTRPLRVLSSGSLRVDKISATAQLNRIISKLLFLLCRLERAKSSTLKDA